MEGEGYRVYGVGYSMYVSESRVVGLFVGRPDEGPFRPDSALLCGCAVR